MNATNHPADETSTQSKGKLLVYLDVNETALKSDNANKILQSLSSSATTHSGSSSIHDVIDLTENSSTTLSKNAPQKLPPRSPTTIKSMQLFESKRTTSSAVVDLTKDNDNHPVLSPIVDLTDASHGTVIKNLCDINTIATTTTSSRSIQALPRSRKKQKLTNVHDFECTICLEKYISAFKGYTLSQCHHKFCLLCLSKHIQTSSKTKMQCPECSKEIYFQDVQSILTAVGAKSELETYVMKANTELLEKEIVQGNSMMGEQNLLPIGENKDEDEENNENKMGGGETTDYNGRRKIIETTRRCPGEHCNYIFIYQLRNPEHQEGTRFDCPQCFNSYCLQCGANHGQVGPAHEGNCYDRREQLRKEQEERRKFEEWKIQNEGAESRFREMMNSEKGIFTKPCPNCNVLITKNGGCDHMFCRQCEEDFYWSKA